MDFNERLNKSQAKMDELKDRINQSSERHKNARALKKEEIRSDMASVDQSINDFADRVEEIVNNSLDKSDKAINDFADKTEAAVNKSVDATGQAVNDFADAVEENVNGNVAAAEERARIAKEKRDQKLNSARLQAQMNKEAKQEKITAKKEAIDKASQERRIVELLDYADSCQDLTLAMALETEAAVLEAAAEIADYNEKYGDK